MIFGFSPISFEAFANVHLGLWACQPNEVLAPQNKQYFWGIAANSWTKSFSICKQSGSGEAVASAITGFDFCFLSAIEESEGALMVARIKPCVDKEFSPHVGLAAWANIKRRSQVPIC